MSGNLVVAVRVRPLNVKVEIAQDAQSVISVKDNSLQITSVSRKESGRKAAHEDAQKSFTFDNAFDSHSSDQLRIHKVLGVALLDKAFLGYNCCIFSYGQTGSGKSYTMMGTEDDKGLIPRICEDLFLRINSVQDPHEIYNVEVSYLEIYSEKVRDLLSPHAKSSLRIREHPVTGPYVEDLTRYHTGNMNEVQLLMRAGNEQRSTACTNMNQASSRSHAVFTIILTHKSGSGDMASERVSKISLIDLAGSERSQKTGASGARLKEGADINKSLSTLGRVITALAAREKRASSPLALKVPYRDSTLTWLLKDSLGGNSLTAMVATVSSSEFEYEESLSTLRFAGSAKMIRTNAIINEDPNLRMIKELKAELAMLRAKLQDTSSDRFNIPKSPSSYGSYEVSGPDRSIKLLSEPEVLDRMQQTASLIAHINLSWEGKLAKKWKLQSTREKEAEDLIAEDYTAVIGIGTPKRTPYLINLSEDILQPELLVYNLRLGDTRCGNSESTEVEMRLSGPSIQTLHCVFTNTDGVVDITRYQNASISINEHLIATTTRLAPGDQVNIGDRHTFQFGDPRKGNMSKQNRQSSPESTGQSSLSVSILDAPLETIQSPAEAQIASHQIPVAKLFEGVQITNSTGNVAESSENFPTHHGIGASGWSRHTEKRDRAKDIHAAVPYPLAISHADPTILQHRKRSSYSDMLLQKLNAERLEAEAKGISEEVPLLERLQAVRDDVEQQLGQHIQELDECQKANKLISPEREMELSRSTFTKWRTLNYVKLCRDVQSQKTQLTEAQSFISKTMGSISFQHHVQQIGCVPVSPYEDDHVYQSLKENTVIGRTGPRLLVRVMDSEKKVLLLWSARKFNERLSQMMKQTATRNRETKRSSRDMQLLQKPLPRYVLYGRTLMPVLCSELSGKRRLNLDIYSPYTNVSTSILSVDVTVNTRDEHGMCDVSLIIQSITGLTEQELSDVHVHTYFQNNEDCRLTTSTISNFGDRSVDFFSRYLCQISADALPDVMIFEVYGTAGSTFFDQILSWDELQESNVPTPDILHERKTDIGQVAVCRLKITELNAAGDYTSCEVVANGEQGSETHCIHQGLSRRLSLSFQCDDNGGRIRMINKICVSEVRSTQSADDSTDTNDLSEPVILKLITNGRLVQSPGTDQEFSDVTGQWDSSMHNTKLLDCTTPPDRAITLLVTADVEFEDSTKMQLRIPITVRVYGREERHGYFTRFFSSAPVLPCSTTVFTIPTRWSTPSNASNLIQSTPSFDRLHGWKPRGISLVRNAIKMSRAQRAALAVHETRLTYTADQLKSNQYPRQSPSRDYVIDIIEYWKKITRRSDLNLAARISSSFQADAAKLEPQIISFSEPLQSGDVRLRLTEKWTKKYLELRPPYLLQYTALSPKVLERCINLLQYTMTVTDLGRQSLFSLFKHGIEMRFLANTREMRDLWINQISEMAQMER